MFHKWTVCNRTTKTNKKRICFKNQKFLCLKAIVDETILKFHDTILEK